MTVTLHLKPDVEAGLLAQAHASGMILEEYLLRVMENAARPVAGKDEPAVHCDRAEAVRHMIEFGQKHRLSLGQPVTRALLHQGHRF